MLIESTLIHRASPTKTRFALPVEKTERVSDAVARLARRKANFKSRQSILDREYLHVAAPPMRGFLALFWITVFLYAAVSLYRNPGSQVMGLSLQLWSNSYRELEVLLVAAAAIFLYTFAVLPYQLLLARRVLDSRSYAARYLSRHALQVVPVLMALFVARYRDWPNLQTGTLLIFAICMDMKMHSFLSTNELLDKEYHRLRSRGEAKTTSSGSISYPANLCIENYTRYLCFPTLIYQLEYPRTERIRWTFVAERSTGILVIFAIFYIVVEQYIYPILQSINHTPVVDTFVDLLLPCLASALLVFFLIFEYLLNWTAEVTRFADREFYADWWNSTDMGEFARKWNIPVHRFLQQHVYEECQAKWAMSRPLSMTVTFFYSSVFHEIVMSSVVGRLKVWILAMQMSQIPLMWLVQVTGLKRYPFLANCIWWLMIIVGIPLLVILYSRDLKDTAP